MTSTILAVTGEQYEILMQQESLLRTMRMDSQYWMTAEDKELRTKGIQACADAISRHEGWQARWLAADGELERLAICDECKLEEREMMTWSFHRSEMAAARQLLRSAGK